MGIDLQALLEQNRGGRCAAQRCSIERLLEHLEPTEVATITAWLADAVLPHRQIARTLQAVVDEKFENPDNLFGDGFSLRANTVARHRKGECQCL